METVRPIQQPKIETLIATKQRLLKIYACDSLLLDLTNTLDEIAALEEQKAKQNKALFAATKFVDEYELLELLKVDGKNADARKGELIKALRDDKAHGWACKARDDAQDAVTQTTIDISTRERHTKAIEYELKYRIAAIRFLGGE